MNRDEERAIEWDCQKTMRQYYDYVDHRDFDSAANLFTEDIDWLSHGVRLQGRKELREGLQAALGEGTIRHVLSNTVVNVIDEDSAELVDCYAALRRTPEGWRIAKRRAPIIFRRNPDEPVRLETWGEKAGKITK
jgi:ketosteroid isomerase-like protein